MKEGNSFRQQKDSEYSPSSPLQDDAEEDPGHVSRSPSPSLIADLSRLSDRQDDGPRWVDLTRFQTSVTYLFQASKNEGQ